METSCGGCGCLTFLIILIVAIVLAGLEFTFWSIVIIIGIPLLIILGFIKLIEVIFNNHTK